MEIYHDNGQLKTTYNYKDGKLDGPLVHFPYPETDIIRVF